MRKRRNYYLSGIAMVTGCLLIFAIVTGKHRSEPVYQGNTFCEWLEDYSTSYSPKARHAVQEIGTNGIPFLLDMLQRRQPLVRYFDHTNERRYLAWFGFNILGRDAHSAAPALLELAKSGEDQIVRCEAIRCLEQIDFGREMPIADIIRVLHDTDRRVGSTAAGYIVRYYPEEAENANVYALFPAWQGFPTNKTNKAFAK